MLRLSPRSNDLPNCLVPMLGLPLREARGGVLALFMTMISPSPYSTKPEMDRPRRSPRRLRLQSHELADLSHVLPVSRAKQTPASVWPPGVTGVELCTCSGDRQGSLHRHKGARGFCAHLWRRPGLRRAARRKGGACGLGTFVPRRFWAAGPVGPPRTDLRLPG